jgi:hypothetical protein
MKGGSLRVIVVEPRPRHSSSDFKLGYLPSRIHQAPRSTTTEGDIKAATTIQMQRLLEWSDADDATIARRWRTGFSPLDVNAREDTMPSTGKAAPTSVAVAKASTQGTL